MQEKKNYRRNTSEEKEREKNAHKLRMPVEKHLKNNNSDQIESDTSFSSLTFSICGIQERHTEQAVTMLFYPLLHVSVFKCVRCSIECIYCNAFALKAKLDSRQTGAQKKEEEEEE